MILLILEYQNRYCWLFVMMVVGMAISFFSISLHLTKFGNYYYSFTQIFKLDYSIFSYAGLTFKLPFTTLARMMNFGIALYLLAVPLFIYEFTNNNEHNKMRIVILLALMVYNFCFYDPINAYFAYISHNNPLGPGFYARCISVLHLLNRIWLFAYLFYPVYILFRYFIANTVRFIKRQIFFLAICPGVMNLLFYSVFFWGPFMMSTEKAFATGFWVFENIQIMFYRYYLVIPLLTVVVLLFTLLLLLNYRLGSLVNIFVGRKIRKNIIRMNDLLGDALHSQKNLLFSINILAKKSFSETGNEAAGKIEELTESSLAQTSQMLETLRNIRYRFKHYSLIAALNDALEKTVPCIKFPGISLVFDKEKYKPDSLMLRFDYFHIVQVFVNLLNNAVEAIEGAGRDRGIIRVDITVQFQWIFVIIEDNGIGIKKETMKNLFKPFSGSKPGNLNWGLGLSYAYKVIKAHWGYLRIESKYGEGTSVLIMLPKAKK
jgi:signal transduction histidine kinase